MTTRFESLRRLAKTNTSPTTLAAVHIWLRDDSLYLDPPYQREYVWTQKEQDNYLLTLLAGYPTGVICIAEDTDSNYKETKWMEVVDGRQRITTLKLFFDGEIGFPMPDGSRLFYPEFTPTESRIFRNTGIDMLTMKNATEKDKLNFFYRVNFGGVPQSEEHKSRIMEMMK